MKIPTKTKTSIKKQGVTGNFIKQLGVVAFKSLSPYQLLIYYSAHNSALLSILSTAITLAEQYRQIINLGLSLTCSLVTVMLDCRRYDKLLYNFSSHPNILHVSMSIKVGMAHGGHSQANAWVCIRRLQLKREATTHECIHKDRKSKNSPAGPASSISLPFDNWFQAHGIGMVD